MRQFRLPNFVNGNKEGYLIEACAGLPLLNTPPDPTYIHTTAAPGWYMIPFFSLFALIPPAIESCIIFLALPPIILLMLSLPFLSNKGERSPVKF